MPSSVCVFVEMILSRALFENKFGGGTLFGKHSVQRQWLRGRCREKVREDSGK